jgi:hypothetical protein
MASPARGAPLKLLPHLAQQATARAAQLNLPLSGYIAILIWNQTQSPAPLRAEPDSPTRVRVNVPCYMRRTVAPLARALSRSSHLSVNALAEALIARDLRAGGNLIVYSKK